MFDSKDTHVAISRARHHSAIYTDSHKGLAVGIESRTVEWSTAPDTDMARAGPKAENKTASHSIEF